MGIDDRSCRQLPTMSEVEGARVFRVSGERVGRLRRSALMVGLFIVWGIWLVVVLLMHSRFSVPWTIESALWAVAGSVVVLMVAFGVVPRECRRMVLRVDERGLGVSLGSFVRSIPWGEIATILQQAEGGRAVSLTLGHGGGRTRLVGYEDMDGLFELVRSRAPDAAVRFQRARGGRVLERGTWGFVCVVAAVLVMFYVAGCCAGIDGVVIFAGVCMVAGTAVSVAWPEPERRRGSRFVWGLVFVGVQVAVIVVYWVWVRPFVSRIGGL